MRQEFRFKHRGGLVFGKFNIKYVCLTALVFAQIYILLQFRWPVSLKSLYVTYLPRDAQETLDL